MPEGLSGPAQTAWKHIVPILGRMGVLTIADGAALAGYCQMFARWIEAEAAIQQYGIMVPRKSPEGVVLRIEVNPAVRVGSDALRHMRNFAAEFGLTPASRVRLEVEGLGIVGERHQAGDDPWAKFGAPDAPPVN